MGVKATTSALAIGLPAASRAMPGESMIACTAARSRALCPSNCDVRLMTRARRGSVLFSDIFRSPDDIDITASVTPTTIAMLMNTTRDAPARVRMAWKFMAVTI